MNRIAQPSRWLLPLLLVAAMAGTAAAAPAAKAPAPLPAFDDVDKDKDGIVTLHEVDVYPDAIAARLRKCDADKDTNISRDEYARCEHAAHAAAVK